MPLNWRYAIVRVDPAEISQAIVSRVSQGWVLVSEEPAPARGMRDLVFRSARLATGR